MSRLRARNTKDSRSEHPNRTDGGERRCITDIVSLHGLTIPATISPLIDVTRRNIDTIDIFSALKAVLGRVIGGKRPYRSPSLREEYPETVYVVYQRRPKPVVIGPAFTARCARRFATVQQTTASTWLMWSAASLLLWRLCRYALTQRLALVGLNLSLGKRLSR